MVALKRSEISPIENFVAWPRGLGYVLDYSDRTFASPTPRFLWTVI